MTCVTLGGKFFEGAYRHEFREQSKGYLSLTILKPGYESRTGKLRYMVEDVDASIESYSKHLGFTHEINASRVSGWDGSVLNS